MIKQSQEKLNKEENTNIYGHLNKKKKNNTLQKHEMFKTKESKTGKLKEKIGKRNSEERHVSGLKNKLNTKNVSRKSQTRNESQARKKKKGFQQLKLVVRCVVRKTDAQWMECL